MEQMQLPFASREAEEIAAREAIAARLRLLERAALAVGIKWDEVGGRVLRALGHLCGSRRQLEQGLTGLRWAGSVAELADDAMVEASVARVRSVLGRLEQAGLITRTIRRNFRGQVDGVIVAIEMPIVNRLGNPASSRLSGPVNSFRNRAGNRAVDCAIDSAVECPPNSLPRRDFDYISPSIPNIPPPPIERPTIASVGRSAADEVDSHDGSITVSSPAIDPAPIQSNELRQIEEQLRSIGIERAAPLAREFAQRARDVSEAVQTFKAQRRRFSGPGAVVEFLRSGAWPVGGVKTLEELRAAEARQVAAKRAHEEELARYRAARASPMGDWTEQEREILKGLGVPI